ncbi:MAG: hypothetical protein Q4C58_04265 [Eubacteriales bacterium]|nr:hypothetical protein [Eubacteriales bacterium]
MAMKRLINQTSGDLSVYFTVRAGNDPGRDYETKSFTLPKGQAINAEYGNAQNPYLSGISISGTSIGGIEAYTLFVLKKSSELDDEFNRNDTISITFNGNSFALLFSNTWTRGTFSPAAANGLLPWDNWFYKLSYRRDEVNQLHQQAVELQDVIQQQVTVFNSHLKDYQSLVGSNGALLIITRVIPMSEQQYKDYRVELDAVEKEVTGSVPLEIAEMFSEMVAGTLICDALFNLAKVAKTLCCAAEETEAALEEVTAAAETGIEAGIDAAAETAAITGEAVGEGIAEAAAEAAVEGASFSSLAATGIGIFAAVGIDMIFGAIDGARERDALDQQISALNTAIQKSRDYFNAICSRLTEIDAGIIKEEQRFFSLMEDLAQIAGQEPSFAYSYAPVAAEAENFKNAQRQALQQYGMFHDMKESWLRRLERHPDQTKAEFLDWFIDDLSTEITMDTLEKCWDVLEKHSDSMQKA